MKRFSLLFLLLLAAMAGYAQAPQSLSYQAVARDASGNVLSNKNISLRLSVLNNTTAVFVETFAVTTNAYGMFTVNIGTGTAVTGAFSSIDWAGGQPKSLKTEMDANGGSSFVVIGTTPFQSVPYALVANRISGLNNVNAASPTANQVLRWSGSEWVASTLGTDASLVGDGSSGAPFKLAGQGATSGQVLSWNGSAWVPTTASSTVTTNNTLTGNGSVANPLRIAQQAASNGQVLQWNGTAWVPATVSGGVGDNWGSQNVVTDATLFGNGTSGNPLKLAGQGAAGGQVLKWDVISGTWKPGTDNTGGGGLTLPYNEAISSADNLWNISNLGAGNAIFGVAAGAGVSGVEGRNTGAGTGVTGSVTNGGIAIKANAAGAGSVGLQATGVDAAARLIGYTEINRLGGPHLGIVENSNSTTSPGVIRMRNLTGGRYWQLSSLINANNTDEKLSFHNATGDNHLVITGNKRVGIATTTPLATLDVLGGNGDLVATEGDVRIGNATNRLKMGINVSTGESTIMTQGGNNRLSLGGGGQKLLTIDGGASTTSITGYLAINGSTGTSGQYLMSRGGGTFPTWGSPISDLYNGVFLFDQNADQTVNVNHPSSRTLPGIDIQTITISKPVKLIITVSGSYENVGNVGGGDANPLMQIVVRYKASGVIVNKAQMADVIQDGKMEGFSFTHHLAWGTAGDYEVFVDFSKRGGGDDFVVKSGDMRAQMTIQIIPQN